MRRLVFFVLAEASLSFGQLDSNSVTIRASRVLTNAQPDAAIIGVYVTSNLGTGLDEVLAALQGTGISSANFVGVNTISGFIRGLSSPQLSLSWSFSISVPFAAIKNTVAALSNAQGNIAKQSGGLELVFSVQGSEVSPQLRAAQTCPSADLIADARAQARKLTDAAGLGLGSILALADSLGAFSPWFDVPVFRFGGYSGVLVANNPFNPTSASFVYAIPYFSPVISAPVSCSLTVKFALLRN